MLLAEVASSALQEKKRREREDEERQSHIASRRGMSDMSGLDADVPASPHSRKLRAPGSSPPPAYVPSPSGHPMQNGGNFLLCMILKSYHETSCEA